MFINSKIENNNIQINLNLNIKDFGDLKGIIYCYKLAPGLQELVLEYINKLSQNLQEIDEINIDVFREISATILDCYQDIHENLVRD